MKNKEVKDMMANLYLDGYGSNGPPFAVPDVADPQPRDGSTATGVGPRPGDGAAGAGSGT
jgi:hypothetical protein